MRILIIDPACNKPYDPIVLAQEGLGGTEATVVRIAEALKALGHCVIVAQHNRSSSVSGYTPHTPGLLSQQWDTIIVLRDASLLSHIRAKQPYVPLYLWCHDLPSVQLGAHGAVIRRTRTKVLGVSMWHRDRLRECLPGADVQWVYNTIDADLTPGNAGFVDRNKLCFISSPHKGLDLALAIFRKLRAVQPDFELHVFNPGYLPTEAQHIEGVVWRGSLPQADVVNEVAMSLAVFHPNTVFPETMGIVTAEANAVGTPVLCHPLGATPEIINGVWQLVDCGQTQSVIDTLVLWRNTLPRTVGKPEYSLSEVMKSWTKTLEI